MEKFLARTLLLILNIAAGLGNYWFTFGLWPQSWVSFFGFALAAVVLLLLHLSLDKE